MTRTFDPATNILKHPNGASIDLTPYRNTGLQVGDVTRVARLRPIQSQLHTRMSKAHGTIVKHLESLIKVNSSKPYNYTIDQIDFTMTGTYSPSVPHFTITTTFFDGSRKSETKLEPITVLTFKEELAASENLLVAKVRDRARYLRPDYSHLIVRESINNRHYSLIAEYKPGSEFIHVTLRNYEDNSRMTKKVKYNPYPTISAKKFRKPTVPRPPVRVTKPTPPVRQVIPRKPKSYQVKVLPLDDFIAWYIEKTEMLTTPHKDMLTSLVSIYITVEDNPHHTYFSKLLEDYIILLSSPDTAEDLRITLPRTVTVVFNKHGQFCINE